MTILKQPGSLSPFIVICGGLALAGCQRPSKAALSLPSLAGEFEDQEQGSGINYRPIRGKTDLTGRIQFNLLPDQGKVMRNKIQILNTPFHQPSLLPSVVQENEGYDQFFT